MKKYDLADSRAINGSGKEGGLAKWHYINWDWETMTEKERQAYANLMSVKHAPLQLADVPNLIKMCSKKRCNRTLSSVNDSAIRLGIMEGEYHSHKQCQRR